MLSDNRQFPTVFSPQGKTPGDFVCSLVSLQLSAVKKTSRKEGEAFDGLGLARTSGYGKPALRENLCVLCALRASAVKKTDQEECKAIDGVGRREN
jgi:hypothetical protein